MGRKKIIYLDQNWLSDMAKAQRNEDVRVDKPYFTELFKAIRQAITDDKIVCPTSPLHTSESNLSSKLNVDIRSTDNAISRGLSFNPIEEVCHQQLLDAASKFGGTKPSSEPWWRTPFNRDPAFPDSMVPRTEDSLEVFLTVPNLVDEDQRVRNEVIAPMYGQYKGRWAKFNVPYHAAVEFLRIQLFREHYCIFDNAEPVLRQSFPDWDIIHSSVFRERQQQLAELSQICNNGERIVSFLSSDCFKDAPYLSIHAKLMAADIVYHGNRKPEGSLMDDFDMAATVVPYVNVFATENYLAELLRKTGVARDYGCTVYTMRQKDKFLDCLSRL